MRNEKYRLLFIPDWFLGVEKINKILDIIGFNSLKDEEMKKIIEEVDIRVIIKRKLK